MTDLPENVTRQDFEELKGAVAGLAAALQAREEADTAAETQAAQEDVTEKRADLDQLAKELGVSPAKLRAAAEKAKHDEEKERLRPLLVELLDEELAPAPAEPPADEPEQPAEEETEETEPATEPELEPEDTAPTQEHWSEKTVGQLLGR